jgi:GTP-binding protein HflX
LAVFAHGVDVAGELAELRELARTAGVAIASELVQQRAHPDPRSFVGKGKLVELKTALPASGAEVLIVDDEISPVQQRTLENALDVRVVDRTQLILDIFAQHAVSAEGKLQVELAQLEYNLPRMRGMWKHLERLGGGVGTRGPGETQLESDRREARRRVSLLKGRLKELSKRRETGRKERRRSDKPTIALAGYTNAGKSTLLNALAGASVSVEDRLFETLDPTTRSFEQEGRQYLVTDTVGFIRRLPHQLVEGFAATLEETLVSDLVLHVADASLPEQEMVDQIDAVASVLNEIGADDLPVELVLNKIDRVDALSRKRLTNRYPEAPQISATSGEGLDDLRALLASRFADRFEPVRLLIPHDQAASLSELYELGAPIEERRDEAEGVYILARLSPSTLGRLSRFVLPAEQSRKIR